MSDAKSQATMVPSTRQAVVCIFLVLITAACVCAQSAQEKMGSVSGKVTVKGKAMPGIVVIARERTRGGLERSRYRDTTDQTGNYRINLPAGTYQVLPVALSWVLENLAMESTVMLGDGENVENFNFTLVRGGVITGKITDPEGRPLIEEMVTVLPQDGFPGNYILGPGMTQTDDRGVYRAFALRPGKYRVGVGQSAARLPGNPQQFYRQTFYPSVTDSAKATLIEVTEGSETSDIDIVVGRPQSGFKVKGRIIDAETGKPLPNILYGIFQRIGDHSTQSMSGNVSDARGELTLENVLPGKYSLFISGGDNNNLRGDAVPFEVIDRDVNDLVLKASKGSSVLGVIAFEGIEEKTPTTKLSNLYIHAWTQNTEVEFAGSSTSVPVRPDGSFIVSGLRSGPIHFGFISPGRIDAQRIAIVRIERDGIIQPRGFILKDGEQVSGVRLVLKYLTGSIRGQVKVEGSEDPPASRMSIWLSVVDDGRSGQPAMVQNSSTQVDARGRFLFEGLAAGTYEINVAVFDPGRYDTTQITKQQVTVVDNTVSEVTVTLKRKP